MFVLHNGFWIGELEDTVSLWVTQKLDLFLELSYFGLHFEAFLHFALEALTDELQFAFHCCLLVLHLRELFLCSSQGIPEGVGLLLEEIEFLSQQEAKVILACL